MEKRTKSYLQLIKPGITLSNSMTAAAGFFVAVAHVGFSLEHFIGCIVGIALVIASACVTNNMVDRDIDARMKRTKKRAVAAGEISLIAASIEAALLGLAGFLCLAILTNLLTVLLGVLAYVWYVVFYGIAKRHSPLSTIIGAVPGALPPMAGYVAATGHVDATAWVLFAILAAWQLPHFYAISIFRAGDYKSAKLPVWSVRYGLESARRQIFIGVVLFTLIAPLLVITKSVGFTYLIVMLAASVYWLYQGIAYYKKDQPERWSRRMFGVSLVVLLVFCGIASVGGYLP